MNRKSILRDLESALRNPRRALVFMLWMARTQFAWESCYAELPSPKTASQVPQDSTSSKRVEAEMRRQGFHLEELWVDADRFSEYLEEADYSRFPRYYPLRTEYFLEKALEHYLAADLLKLSENDIYVDVANADSPTPEIYGRLFGCTSYRQDLIFREGVVGRTIGGDAAAMPVPDEFADKMALHCSFEHFEGTSDIMFVEEAGRILAEHGRVCILPLYMYTEYAIQTDPAWVKPRYMSFDEDAKLFAWKGYGNRHGRFYDVDHLSSRIRDNLGRLSMTIYVIRNEKEIGDACYLKFAMLLEKR